MEILMSILLIVIFVNWNTIKYMFFGNVSRNNPVPQGDDTLTDNTQSNSSDGIMDFSVDEKYGNTVVSRSTFQDSLKSATRTAVEVAEEKQSINLNKIKNDVEAMIEKIHNDILLCANQGKYTEIDGKRIVSVLCYIPFEYCIRTEIEPTYAKQYNGIFAGNAPAIDDIDSYMRALFQLSPQERRKCRLVQQTPKKTIFKASSDFDAFISLLCKKAGADGIIISPVIIEHKRIGDTKIEHSFPATLIGNLDFRETSFMAKCECCIPDKYSTDTPVEVDILSEKEVRTETIATTSSKSTISIDAMEEHQFETFCADVRSQNGYTNVEVTRGSGDQSVDIIASNDGVKFGIQCKSYSSNVGNKAIHADEEKEFSHWIFEAVSQYVKTDETTALSSLYNIASNSFFGDDENRFEEITDLLVAAVEAYPSKQERLISNIGEKIRFYRFLDIINPDNTLMMVRKYYSRVNKWFSLFPKFNEINNINKVYCELSAAMLDIADLNEYVKMASEIERGNWWENGLVIPSGIIYKFEYPHGFKGDICKYIGDKYGVVTEQEDFRADAVIRNEIPLEELAVIIEFVIGNRYPEENISDVAKHYYPSMIKLSAARFGDDGRPLYRYRSTLIHNSKENKYVDAVIANHWKQVQNIANRIYVQVVETGERSPRWTSEYRVFTLVHSLYPDAVYQYHVNWLGAQSLDVFIPSLAIGIEYQGMQHYRPVAFFGGEESFAYRQECDKRKKKLCKENGITLIEWKYTEEISLENLNKKMRIASRNTKNMCE